MSIEEKLKELGLILPPPPKPAGAYTPVVISGSTAFLSGQISKKPDGTLLTGRAGSGETDLAAARLAAETAAVNCLSIMHHLIGADRIVRLLRVAGFIQAADGFYAIPKVMDAASELFQKVLGDKGIHARTSVGVYSLPSNVTVEIEVTLQITS